MHTENNKSGHFPTKKPHHEHDRFHYRKQDPSQTRLTREAIRYVVICLFLFLLNYCTSSHHWWAAWVAAGWGLHLLLEGLFYLFDCDEEK